MVKIIIKIGALKVKSKDKIKYVVNFHLQMLTLNCLIPERLKIIVYALNFELSSVQRGTPTCDFIYRYLYTVTCDLIFYTYKVVHTLSVGLTSIITNGLKF